MPRAMAIGQLVLREVGQRPVLRDAVESEQVLAEVRDVEDRQPRVLDDHMRVRCCLRGVVVPHFEDLAGLWHVVWVLEEGLVDLGAELARRRVEYKRCCGLAKVVRAPNYCALTIEASVSFWGGSR